MVKSGAVFRNKKIQTSRREANATKQREKRERRQESTADQQPKTEKYTEMTAKLPTVVS